MSDNLGARLAAQVLRLPLENVFDMNNQSLQGLSVGNVLSAVLERVEAGGCERSSAAVSTGSAAPGGASPVGARPVFLFVVHLDEYQVYVQDLSRMRGSGAEADLRRRRALVEHARHDFKRMLSALHRFARDPVYSRRWRIIMLPVVSGTPVLGVPLLATDELVVEFMPPASLDRTLAEELVASVLLRTQGSSLSPLALLNLSDVLGGLNQDAARAAIGDTGFRPRLLVDLGTNALVPMDAVPPAWPQPPPTC